jgi:hypothetical protein
VQNPAIAGKGREMANNVDYMLEVLATSPEEINRISTRLKQPLPEWLDWVAKSENYKPESLAKWVSFEGPDVGADESSRWFKNECYHWNCHIVRSHVFEVSTEFPNAVFLLDVVEMYAFYYSKRVIRAGNIVQRIDDGGWLNTEEWVLLDIFVPFRNEWESGLPFGSRWANWVGAVKAQLGQLEENRRISNQEEVSGKEVAGTSD